MAVTTTPRVIIAAALDLSLRNRGTADEPGALSAFVRVFRGVYAAAARVNPFLFAVKQAVPLAGGSWARPEQAELIWRIESGGAEVVAVPLGDPGADTTLGKLVYYGQAFRPASADPPDPQAGDLDFYYSKRPSTPATVDAALDALWCESHNDLLVHDLALYRTKRELGARADELEPLRADRDAALALFLAFLEHECTAVRSRYPTVPTFGGDVRSLLAGGL
jgi:hypothetical protein